MAEVKWIKITTDMFDNRKIKHLRRLPEGNNIVLIWVMLLTMAGRCNSNGMIFLTESIPYTPKMLADELDFEENTVKLALQALEQLNMVVTDGNSFKIAGWEEHQNIEGLDRMREQARIRKQRQRQKEQLKLEATAFAQSMSRDCHVTVTDQVTQCHATDKDKEEDNRYYNIISYLNEKTGAKYKATTAKTRSLIHARLAEGFTEEDFRTVIDQKCAAWKGTDMEKYLRPETLFGSKFEGYLNEQSTKKQTAAAIPYQIANNQDDLDDLF